MTKWQRLSMILKALLMIAAALLLIVMEEDAGYFLLGMLSIYLTVFAVRELIYYFSMARFMVGGKYIFYRGILTLDLGVFSGTLTALPSFMVLVFLAAMLGFSGAVNIMNAMDAKKMGAHWRLKAGFGLGSILLAFLSLFFIRSSEDIFLICSAALVYHAIGRILIAMRPTAIVSIQ